MLPPRRCCLALPGVLRHLQRGAPKMAFYLAFVTALVVTMFDVAAPATGFGVPESDRGDEPQGESDDDHDRVRRKATSDPGGDPRCKMCEGNSFSSGGVWARCMPCPEGFAAAEKHDSCPDCAAGYGGALCTKCYAGYSSPGGDPSKAYCERCPDGHFSAQAASERCAFCKDGTVSSLTRTSCVCLPGFGYDGKDMDSCTACTGNTYSKGGALEACLSCGSGRFIANADKTACSGMFNLLSNMPHKTTNSVALTESEAYGASRLPDEAVMKITHHFTPPTSFDAALQELVEFQQQPKANISNYMVRARRHVQTVKMLYWQAVAQARDHHGSYPDLVECVAITLLERGLAGFFKQQYRLSNVPRFDLEEMRTVLESVERTAELRKCETRAAAAAVIPTRFSNGAGRHSNRSSSGPDTGGGEAALAEPAEPGHWHCRFEEVLEWCRAEHAAADADEPIACYNCKKAAQHLWLECPQPYND
ncbi:hypothetical protein JKP88DRAFT_261411 [Tribonema minus]|uniref:Tyrosine-protein kinase ephrin type A/B receptor-like domain-containing protein n=1 Tax=Tribonema minus TaxID=303371 RepID=A0A835YMC2_9STRA|nr:hypothetical protein JKP88DRAFT_261411 [Tribonema minus]